MHFPITLIPLERGRIMELYLENHEASLAFRILRNRANELQREITQNQASNEIEYMKHKAQILSSILTKFSDVDDHAHMRGNTTQEI